MRRIGPMMPRDGVKPTFMQTYSINDCMGVKEYVEKNYPNGVDDFQISIHVTDKPSEDILSMGLKRTNCIQSQTTCN